MQLFWVFLLDFDTLECLTLIIVPMVVVVDSWYANPDFIAQAGKLGMPVIAHIANNVRI